MIDSSTWIYLECLNRAYESPWFLCCTVYASISWTHLLIFCGYVRYVILAYVNSTHRWQMVLIQNSNVSHEWPLLAKNSFPSTSNRHRSSRWDSWLATLRYLRAVSSANGWLLISWLLAEPVLSILIFKWKSLSRAFLSFSPSLCVTVAGIDLYVQVKLYKAYQQVRTKTDISDTFLGYQSQSVKMLELQQSKLRTPLNAFY